MAADTKEKRQAAMRMGQVARGPALPQADSAAARAANLGLYTAGEEASSTPTPYQPYRWIPAVFAVKLDRFITLDEAAFMAAAAIEADGERVWARRNYYGIVRVVVSLVPVPLS